MMVVGHVDMIYVTHSLHGGLIEGILGSIARLNQLAGYNLTIVCLNRVFDRLIRIH